jgi:hypothetical protein
MLDEKKIGNNIITCNYKYVCGVKQQLPAIICTFSIGALILILWSIYIMPLYLDNDMVYMPVICKQF